MLPPCRVLHETYLARRTQAFQKIDDGISDLADYAARQDHKTILGHLRESPSLVEHIEKIYTQFVKPTDGDATELVPQSGMDEEFDTIEKEISEIETELESELTKIAKKLKWVALHSRAQKILNPYQLEVVILA
jgi:hypothetical protein